MMSEINPEKQTVGKCLANNTYKIDFYQREYVWTKKTVEILLDDIMYAFEQSYSIHKNSELSKDILNSFGWYYLNVIMISRVDGNSFIVDGQQRLSTLVLLCAKLRNITSDQRDKKALEDCLFGYNWHDEVYFLDNDKRHRAMDYIINSMPIDEPYTSPTEKNLVERYNDISAYIDQKDFDEKQLVAFIYFVLNKLVVVELDIERYEDTPMIFEVINDRGESLKPFEILKGKLVGALPKVDSQLFSDMWDSAMNDIQGNEDAFFATLIKAKFLQTRDSGKETCVNNEYHRYIFEDNDEARALGFRKQDDNRIENIKRFIKGELKYFVKLYATMLNCRDVNMRYCREIFDVNSQYQLIFAACDVDDPDEKDKITSICKEVDRLNMLLRLNSIYESQKYQDIVYKIASLIKGKPLNEYRDLFNSVLIDEIKERKAVTDQNVDLLDYGSFKKLTYNTSRYFYYLFARVEDYICKEINVQPQNDVFWMSTKHSKNGYHIEHIFSDNPTNIAYFETEDDFREKRNGVGALLLLKGSDNISSGNEDYVDKLQTYSHGPVWGHTLCEEFYNSNVDFALFNKRLQEKTGVSFRAYPEEFTPNDMEERCKLLHELARIIWEA